jgi:DNA recombination protein RmuC
MIVDETTIDILIGLTLGLIIGGVFAFYLLQRAQKRFNSLYKISRSLENTLQKERLENRTLKSKIEFLDERLKEMSGLKDQISLEFESISNRIYQESSQKSSNQIREILTPFRENLDNFHRWIANYYENESKERFSLKREIESLKELNKKISQDAINLTNALKYDNKIQGSWGEMVLKRVLESSGLREGVEYISQKSFSSSDAKKRYIPDIIIKLPKNRDVIIDSKVSLKSYEAFVNAKGDIEEFFDSISRHIDSLSKKEYQAISALNSLDFVLMFIPIEGAFSLLHTKGEKLIEDAYKKGVVIVSPTTLLSVLKVIENGWRFEYQNQNALIIAKRAKELYEKFVLFVEEMQKIDLSLTKAKNSYDEAFKKLSSGRGNLINRSKELKELGAFNSKKDLIEVE